MLKRIATALAGLAFALPANATSWNDINTLGELVSNTGTTISVRECPDNTAHGWYQYNREQNIDLLVICNNVVDMQDPDAVWEVLVHESTHVMQACNGGPILKDSYTPRVLRELQETAPHYYYILQQYRGDHKRMELEAFWMELRSPHVPIKWIRDFCYQDTANDA